ncbi:hypothetical protein RUM43_000691 [Polyplax serrata]|uniref:39S ribosomal protein L28, mitochondrial n=1 Tax=Polyplax serrata TaxID=468196 RepID=A0AAN8XP03_POLSC
MFKNAREAAAAYVRKYKPTLFDSEIGARLPTEYRKFYDEWKNTTPEPVHYIPEKGTWRKDEETGQMKRIENIPLPAFHSKELDNILTGGEKIIFGYIQKKKTGFEVPKFWIPFIYKSVVYSEILNKYISVHMTKRVIELIHKHRGFDSYLLETRACDLGTLLALRLKKKLLFALNDKNLPYDEEKNCKVYEKYKKYCIPPEELEWYGLSFQEACRKQIEIEKAKQREAIIPLKYLFRSQLIEDLKAQGINTNN